MTTGRFYWSSRGPKVDTDKLSAQVVSEFGENVLKKELSAQPVKYKSKDTAVIKVMGGLKVWVRSVTRLNCTCYVRGQCALDCLLHSSLCVKGLYCARPFVFADSL